MRDRGAPDRGLVTLSGGIRAGRRWRGVPAVRGAGGRERDGVRPLRADPGADLERQIYWTYPSALDGRWSGGGPYLSHTHLAESLNLALGLALGLLLGGDRASGPLARSGRIWAAYAVGTLALGVITSHSRGGFLAMLVGVSVTLVGMRTKRVAAWGGLAVVVGVPLLFLFVLGDSVPYFARLETLFDTGERGYVERFAVWGRAWASGGAAALGDGLRHVRPGRRRRAGTGTFSLLRARRERIRGIARRIGFDWVRFGIDAARRGCGALAGVVDVAPADRTLVLGAAGGLLAVLVNCMSDFGLHIPGVAVAATLVFAHLCRLGADDAALGFVRLVATTARRVGAGLPACGVIAWGARGRRGIIVLRRGLPRRTRR